MTRAIYVNGKLATYASTAELELIIKRVVRDELRTAHPHTTARRRDKPPEKVLQLRRC